MGNNVLSMQTNQMSLYCATKDLTNLYQLFSKKQLVELATLRRLICKKTTPSGNKANRMRKRESRSSLLLAFIIL